jgi:Rho termination factor, N-terminal domain
MYDTFIQFNQQIETFQQVLTVMATATEAFMGLIALSCLISSIFGNTAIVVDTQLQIETVTNADIPAIEQTQQLPIESEPPEEKIPAQQFDLDNQNVSELRRMAKSVGLTGYSKLTKSKLVAELQGAYSSGMVSA